MAEIMVDAAQLRSSGADIKNCANEFKNCMDEIKKLLDSIDWEGDANERFKQQVSTLTPSFNAYHQVITSYGEFLEKSAEEYEKSEQTATSTTDDLTNNLYS